jgi:hypothetical protein
MEVWLARSENAFGGHGLSEHLKYFVFILWKL